MRSYTSTPYLGLWWPVIGRPLPLPTYFSYGKTVPVHIAAWGVEVQLYAFLTMAVDEGPGQ
jgi:hypothetical protein